MILEQVNTIACDGTDVFWPWFLWLLAAFILGIILGWLLKSLFAAPAAKPEPVIQKQDLKKIEGIGPKIEKLLNDAGVISYRQLADTPLSKLKKILADGDPASPVHNPVTWSAQARLADDGQWEALAKWQAVLDGGV